jgi:hypothetical protein
MKQHLFSIMAIIAALTMAFCTKERSEGNGRVVWPYNYYTYIGEDHNYFQQQDPTYYVQDEDGFPDCLNTMGHTVCSIKAMGDAWVEGQPDMNTIISKWYRPL